MLKTKKNNNTFGSLLLLLILIVCSCSSDDQSSNGGITYIASEITTLPAQVSGVNVTLGVELTIAGNPLSGVGVVYSQQPNPTFEDESVGQSTAQTGQHTFLVSDLQTNTTYYARAYANQDSFGIQYGNEISFTTGTNITTLTPINIYPKKATLNGSVIANTSGISTVGFVYGTSPSPTTLDNFVTKTVAGTTDYSIEITNLTPNTLYYVRAYNSGLYGEQLEFKTTGYTGPAGGYVLYDKGLVTDNWRFLEMHTESLHYNGGPGASWGQAGNFISGISTQMGFGPENTVLITNATAGSNCAAKLCQNLSLNGFSDWFLGSSEEMLLLTNALRDIGIEIHDSMWTSSQISADLAQSIYKFGVNDPYTIFPGGQAKTDFVRVYPVRRY